MGRPSIRFDPLPAIRPSRPTRPRRIPHTRPAHSPASMRGGRRAWPTVVSTRLEASAYGSSPEIASRAHREMPAPIAPLVTAATWDGDLTNRPVNLRPVVVFKSPETLELAVAFTSLVAIDRQLLQALVRSRLVTRLPLFRLLEDPTEMLRAGEAVRLQLRKAAVAPSCGDLVRRRVGATGERAVDGLSGHGRAPMGQVANRPERIEKGVEMIVTRTNGRPPVGDVRKRSLGKARPPTRCDGRE